MSVRNLLPKPYPITADFNAKLRFTHRLNAVTVYRKSLILVTSKSGFDTQVTETQNKEIFDVYPTRWVQRHAEDRTDLFLLLRSDLFSYSFPSALSTASVKSYRFSQLHSQKPIDISMV